MQYRTLAMMGFKALQALALFALVYPNTDVFGIEPSSPSQETTPPVLTGTPAEQFAAAYVRLDALQSYRERRDFSAPNQSVTIVEFSGHLQRWITQIYENNVPGIRETIWNGGRSATREIPFAPQWECFPPVPDEAINPPTTIRDGGSLTVNGKPARRLIEEFVNQMRQSEMKHEVDIDTATGVPIRLISTETEGRRITKYVGVYYDLGVPITIIFPCK